MPIIAPTDTPPSTSTFPNGRLTPTRGLRGDAHGSVERTSELEQASDASDRPRGRSPVRFETPPPYSSAPRSERRASAELSESPGWPPSPYIHRARRGPPGVEAPPPPSQQRHNHLLAAIDERLNTSLAVLQPGPSPSAFASSSMAAHLHAFDSVPQYDRTHLQGCVCRPALAGGACCPTGASGASLTPHLRQPAPAGMPGGVQLSLGMGFATALGAGLAAFSLKLALEVVVLARDALLQLHDAALRAEQRQRHSESRLVALQPWQDALPATLAGHRRTQHAEYGLLRELAEARGEQRFYWAVPGILQATAAAALGVHLIDHAFGHGLSAALGVPSLAGWLGVVGPALFASYGVAFALRNGYLLWRHRGEVARAQAHGNTPLGHALVEQAQARRRQGMMALVSWALVAAMGTVGSLASAGVGVAAAALGGWLFVGTAAVGIVAAVINACSRYAPHLPVGPHIEREQVDDPERREVLRWALVEQDAAIRSAVATLEGQRPADVKVTLRRAWERATQPQCGERAFVVTPQAVAQTARAALGDEVVAQALRKQDELAILKGIVGYLAAERKAVDSTLQLERRRLLDEESEWCALFGGGRMAYPQEPLDAQLLQTYESLLRDDVPGHQALRAELMALLGRIERHHERALRLTAIDAAHAEALSLIERAGELSNQGQSHCCLSPEQRRFSELRVMLLLMSGTLRDAVDGPCFERLVELGAHRRDEAHWPYGLNNLSMPPHKLSEMVDALAPSLDYGFVHAFFNPRRMEAEIDYLLTLGLQAPVVVPEGPAALSAATCCAPL